jgi:hypothetical protein
MRLLSRALPLLAVGAFLFAGAASALPTTYTLIGGSQMSMTNAACAPCTVAVTGTVTLDDDGLGTVTLTDVSLAHASYQVGLVPIISVELERTNISLGAGPVVGAGSLTTDVVFGSTDITNIGTSTCTDGGLTCASLGIPAGASPLPTPLVVNLGTWDFDSFGSGFTATFQYFTIATSQGPATETLTLVAAIPEPTTGLLVAMGMIGLALRRRL